MSSAPHEHASLSYFQTSPVRGQLEPYEPQSRAGWRYLQCTDTPNELKVLLPPKTALLYSQLLQYESSELARGRTADWDRVLHIRHLKDRMIRKCQRLSRMTHTPGTAPAAFRIVHAPPDFRLKEMERWLRDQERGKSTKEVRRQPSAETTNTQSQSSNLTYAHAQPSRSPRQPRVPTSSAPPQRGQSTRAPGSIRRHGSGSTRSSNYVDSRASVESPRQRPSVHTQTISHRNAFLSPVVEERTESPSTSTALTNPYGETPQPPVEDSPFAGDAAMRADAVSPDPLPHLYRPPSMLAPMGELVAAMMAGSPPEQPPLMQGIPEPFVESFAPTEPVAPPMPEPSVSVIPGQSIAGPPRPHLVRRRSSLRQNGGRSSANGTPKVVSWAMDRDWADYLTKFDHVIYAAEFAGSELEEARKRYQEEISSVQDLRSTITNALERLRLESDTLQREDAALRAREERMVSSFERLKDKEVYYKERVQAVVDESKRAVIAADNRRESAAGS
ncbi:hypothetical protein F5888DRAFT_1797915 [Russula emetica]|nr:hypothetical protein F5888DRAFT_1797915 [Russula emetica]